MKPLSQIATERYRAHTKTNPCFAKVYFAARQHFDLSVTEAALCDIVDILSRKTGWCFASRGHLASLLGVSQSTIRRCIARLVERGLVVRGPQNQQHLKVTAKWRSATGA